MSLRLSVYQNIPKPTPDTPLVEVSVAALRPTQWCVGYAEVWARQVDFSSDSRQTRLDYLRKKPVPMVRNAAGSLWMVDRHHRLRSLLGIDPEATTWGYVIAEVDGQNPTTAINYLQTQGWLYLHDSRGQGPRHPSELPGSLLTLEDDPYRSLVWKLKQEGLIKPQAHIPYHEFRWAAWLRQRPLPPFSSRQLEPALAPARRLVCSESARNMAGWKGEKQPDS